VEILGRSKRKRSQTSNLFSVLPNGFMSLGSLSHQTTNRTTPISANTDRPSDYYSLRPTATTSTFVVVPGITHFSTGHFSEIYPPPPDHSFPQITRSNEANRSGQCLFYVRSSISTSRFFEDCQMSRPKYIRAWCDPHASTQSPFRLFSTGRVQV